MEIKKLIFEVKLISFVRGQEFRMSMDPKATAVKGIFYQPERSDGYFS